MNYETLIANAKFKNSDESIIEEHKLDHDMKYSMIVKPESTLIIPLKACNFESVQIRPLNFDNA
jgi:hypothetical protein